MILDEGWYALGDLMWVVPGIDMNAIAVHARQKNVGLILWVVWKTFDRQMAAALDQFEKWGVKGIKVDFMQREDQWMVNFYERVAREAAKRRLLVDFYGAYKPTGLYRTADSPSNYRKEPDSLAFLSAVPTVWDETRVLGASVGEHVAVARRNGREWYVGAMTSWTARDLDLDLSFLSPGSYEADIHRDGPKADRAGVDYVRETRPVTASDRLRVHLAPGGGFAARIVAR